MVTVVVLCDQRPVRVIQPQVRVRCDLPTIVVRVAVDEHLGRFSNRELPLRFLRHLIRGGTDRERAGDSENE